MLNRIWLAFFFISLLLAAWKGLVLGDASIFAEVVEAAFKAAKVTVEISIGLIGILALWLGLFQVAEQAGLIQVLARWLSPLFQKLMPEVPAGHPAIGSVTMNLAANMLGLDNAATPMGLKAMKDLQSLNPTPERATNAQILFLVLNSASVTLIPVSVFMFRAQQGAADPASVFLPILLATSTGTLTGLAAVAWVQKLQLFNRVVLTWAAGCLTVMVALVTWLMSLSPTELSPASSMLGNGILLLVIVGFLAAGVRAKISVYEHFVTGARQGFDLAVGLIPYLLAMLVAIAMLRASGALEALLSLFQLGFSALGFNTDFLPALPTALMKSLSGSGARAMMLETMQTYGVDSFPALVSAVIQGSSETTFYVLAVYFGSVGIRNERHALACGLLADLVSVVTAILVAYWFFHP